MKNTKTIILSTFCCLLLIAACKKSSETKPDAITPPKTVVIPDMYFMIDSVKHILPRGNSYYNVVQSAGLKTLYYTYNDTTVQIEHKLINLKEGDYTNMQDYWDSTEVICQMSVNNKFTTYRFIQGTYKIVKENGKFVSIITAGSDFYDTYRWKKGEMRFEWPE